MKNNKLLISAILFFMLVNSLWLIDSFIGPWSIVVFLLMAVAYCALGLGLFFLVIDLAGSRFGAKKEVATFMVVVFVMVYTFIFPAGVLPYFAWLFNDGSSKNLLVASLEGTANCRETFYLIDDKRFAEEVTCFSSNKVHGNYTKRNDTLFFEVTEPGRANDPYFQFAVFKNDSVNGKQIDSKLLMFYDNYQDANPRRLWVRHSNLDK